MFYDALMEKRAQREEARDTAPGSLVASAVGAGAGALGFRTAEKSKGRLGDFIRKGREEADFRKGLAWDEGVRELGLINDMWHVPRDPEELRQFYLKDYDQATSILPRGGLDPMNKLVSVLEAHPTETEWKDAYGQFIGEMRKLKPLVQQGILDEINSIDAPLLRRQRLLQGGSMLGGAAMSYGAKKLYDMYNQRKQQRY